MRKGKILFTDLDGTLLSEDQSVSEENQNAIKRALSEEKWIAAATGRPLESGIRQMERLGLTAPGCYMIAFNGSVLYDCYQKKILSENTIPLLLVKTLIQKAGQAKLYIQTYDKTHILAKEHTKELDFYAGKTGMPYRIAPDLENFLQEEPYKALLISLENRKTLEDFQKENEVWTKQSFNCFFSCNEYLEYCPKGVSKGDALLRLCSILGIMPSCAVAVGDECNDISMLKAAGIGAAVKNAVQKVKEAADYVTKQDHNHNAVAEVIERFLL